MLLTAIQSLLNEAIMLRKAQQLVGERPGERFNIFKILGMESDEVYTHSQLLAELLSPNGSHGLGDTFLKIWLEQFAILDFDSTSAKCTAEHYIGSLKEAEGGRIDIMIFNQANKVIIENKIFAGDQKNQLLRYYNYDKKAKLFYLTLFGTEPGEESTGKGQLKPEQYNCISYAVDILQWLERCRKEAVNIPILRETITQYILLIKKLTNQNFDGKMQLELVNKILENPDNLTSFFELQSPSTTQSVHERIINKMEAGLIEMTSKLHLSLNFYLQSKKKWHGFTIFNHPDLKALEVWIDFQFDQFPHGLKFGFSFPPDSIGRPAKPAFSLSPLVEEFKIVYPGAKSHDWWPCYSYMNYSATEVCNEIYFSNAFIDKVEEKVMKMLEIVNQIKGKIKNT